MKFDCPHCGRGIELRPIKAQRENFDHEQALALLRFGATVGEVAKAFGVTPQAVSALKRRRSVA